MHLNGNYNLRELGDDLVLIGEATGADRHLVRINESAAFLWRSVSGKEFDTEDLASLLQGEYGIDAGVASSDAASIVAAWKSSGLVTE
ncbi:MAG: PqqD family protein [Bacteroidales bacterium]|nr:PqqD family protein [Bacteroidales bacterium]